MPRGVGRIVGLWALAAALAGCVATPPPAPEDRFYRSQPTEKRYVPIARNLFVTVVGNGLATVLSEGVAVVAAGHRAELDPKTIVEPAQDLGLLFFPTEKYILHLPTAAPYDGEKVRVYGAGEAALTKTEGAARVPAPVDVACAPCAGKSVFAFAAALGKEYLGSPVVDAQTGKLLGFIFALGKADGRDLAYAQSAARVQSDLQAALKKLPVDPD